MPTTPQIQVTETKIRIADLVDRYSDDGEDGIIAYGGQLDVRPHYQRESVYNREKQDAVIDSISKGLPISIMYWAKRDDGGYEILDGQQRTIAICEYVIGKNSFNEQYFDRDDPNTRERDFLRYPLIVYICDGDFEEKMKWYETVNIAGVPLKPQEIRNAVYAGKWTSDARRWFSKRNCHAYRLSVVHKKGRREEYLDGSCLRQDYLETAIQWAIGSKNATDIREYMGKHAMRVKKSPNTKDPAKHLYEHFEKVLNWAKAVFPNYRKQMKGQNWGDFYRQFSTTITAADATRLDGKISVLMKDDEVQNKKGIYAYVLTGDEKHLNLRDFSEGVKSQVYETQGGVCPDCNKEFPINRMEADHITPWVQGGKTIAENCEVVCTPCHKKRTRKQVAGKRK